MASCVTIHEPRKMRKRITWPLKMDFATYISKCLRNPHYNIHTACHEMAKPFFVARIQGQLPNLFRYYSIQQSIAFLTSTPSLPINPFFSSSCLFKALSSIFLISPTFNNFILSPQNSEYKL